ncbi:hypothetical protein MSPP1_003336 [Malassezia sp. CBS 17886]|nr:hypothetical protein MSPP1_003336 [Malassezia sp. CBS 17886]
MGDVSAARAGAFYVLFSQRLDALRALVRRAGPRDAHVVDALLAARRELQTASPALPSHDVQQYEHALRALQQEAGEKAHTRAFRFRRGGAGAGSPGNTGGGVGSRGAPTPAPPRGTAHEGAHDLAPDPAHARAAEGGTKAAATRGTSPVRPPAPGSLSLRDTANRIVDLRADPPLALHLHDMADCVVFCGHVAGSILMERCARCVLVGSSGQCRLFESRAVAVLVTTSSTVTVERATQGAARAATSPGAPSFAHVPAAFDPPPSSAAPPSVLDFDAPLPLHAGPANPHKPTSFWVLEASQQQRLYSALDAVLDAGRAGSHGTVAQGTSAQGTRPENVLAVWLAMDKV